MSAEVKPTAVEGFQPPPAPESLGGLGFDESIATGIMLKLAAQVPSVTTQTAVRRLRLPRHLIEEICWSLKNDRFLEVIEQSGPLTYRYAATKLGREQAAHLMEVSRYVGPVPVSVDNYGDMIRLQMQKHVEKFTLDDVRNALRQLVLPEEVLEVAALAASSRRGLFVFGPPGNGKTSLGMALHQLFGGDLWIPYCICVDHSIIRLFDEHIHKVIEADDADGVTVSPVDQRWVRIRRPFIVSGGEMTMDELDLAYSPSLRYYEAPPHVKANGGTFMIDDFGRQRIEPHELLNRWIIPLEHRTDHLSLVSGQKLQLPFELMLIVATNLKVSDVADPAFLRRMGYRLHVDKPSPEHYASILRNYATTHQIQLQEGIIDEVLQRYKAEGRDLRGSEPRDLLERAKDICELRNHEMKFDSEVLATAWRGYFGNTG